MSPGLHSLSPFFNFTGAPKSPSGRSATSVRTGSDRSSARSPKEFMTSEMSVSHAPPSPLAQQTDGMEYFSDAVVKLGTSPATGLLIQSPDGQPTGIFFHPKARTPSNPDVLDSPQMEPSKAQEGYEVAPSPRHRSFRITSGESKDMEEAIASSSSAPALRTSYSSFSITSENSDTAGTASPSGKGKGRQASFSEERALSSVDEDLAASGVVEAEVGQSPGLARSYTMRRQGSHTSNATSPPTSPQVRSPNGLSPGTRRGRRPTMGEGSPSMSASKKNKPSATAAENIVPPISVLVVDGMCACLYVFGSMLTGTQITPSTRRSCRRSCGRNE